MAQITGLCEDSGILWCGTEGGLLAFDPDTDSFLRWTNTDGMHSVNVTAVATDPEGYIWIGFNNGNIQRYDPETDAWLLVEDYEENRITCLAVAGDTLFVGLDIGVSLYLVSRREVKETYRNLGFRSAVGNYITDIPVNDILTTGNSIWVGTDEGLAQSLLDNRNLLDPENWNQYTITEGLANNQITALIQYEEDVYAGSPWGISEWDGHQWQIISSAEAFDLIVHRDRLYVAAYTGVMYRDGEQWVNLGAASSRIHHLVSSSSLLWGGSEQGLFVYSDAVGSWEQYLPDGPASRLISDVAVDQSGAVWCCSRDKGFFGNDGSRWVSYDRDDFPGRSLNDFVSTLVDDDNNKWFGSWGEGVICLTPDSTFQFYNAENGYFAGITEDHDYAVIPDMAVDAYGTLWMLNYRSLTDLPLVTVTADLQWNYYGLSDGLNTSFIRVIAVDLENRKWLGSESNGIYIVDDNGTPLDKTDDRPVERITTDDGLETNQITALAADREGGMWIGTPEGLFYYFFDSISRRYGLPSDNITALVVDGANNVWVGTSAGLCLFTQDSYQCTLFTEENSGLVNNQVNTLALDPESGILYIGTVNGLSSLYTPYSEPRAELSELAVYPNPFIPEEHGSVAIDDLAEDVAVHIFTTSGYLVRSYSQDQVYGRRILWEGTNQEGEPVAGGIYLVVVSKENGESRLGKVALVR
jgi:ligand-binding sensor domain-containing protein